MMNAFKQAEKRYKLKKSDLHGTDFSGVIDFADLNKPASARVRRVPINDENQLSEVVEAFAVEGFEGFYFLQNALDVPMQCIMAGQSLCQWCEPAWSSNSNLHGHHHTEKLSAWLKNDHNLLQKLRWVTLGYHYDWSARAYREGWQSPFPPSLAAFSKSLAALVGFHEFTPEAAIVNIYHDDSMMGGHRDELEIFQEPPVISVSLGNACIFLLGGLDKRKCNKR